MSSNLIKLGFTSFFTDISSEMIFPFIGIYLTIIGSSPLIIGIVEGVAESLAYSFRFLSGYTADYFHNKKIPAITGYSLSMIGKIFLYFPFIYFIIAGRWLDRLGKSIRNAPRDALISESVLPKKKGEAFGFHRFMDTLGAFIGVLFSLVFYIYVFHPDDNLQKKEFIQNLILLSVIPAFIGVLILFFVKEKNKNIFTTNQKFTEGIKNLRNILKKEKKLVIFLIINFLFAISNSSDQFIFIYGDQIHISLKEILMAYLFYNLSYVMVSYPAGKISDKLQRKYIIALGYLIYSLVYFFIPDINSFMHFILIFLFYGIYKGLTEGVEKAYVTDFTEEFRSTLLGFHSIIFGTGIFISSLIGGFIWNYFDITYLFYFDSLIAFMCIILVLKFL